MPRLGLVSGQGVMGRCQRRAGSSSRTSRRARSGWSGRRVSRSRRWPETLVSATGRSGTGSTPSGAAVVRATAGRVRTSGPSWFGCAGRTPSCGCGVTYSNAAWSSGFRKRWAGSRGRVHRGSEGPAWQCVLGRGRGPSRPDKSSRKALDLLRRKFTAPAAPNLAWVGELTEIPNDEGPLHLAAILDLHSRRAVGFALDAHHDAQLAAAALQVAIAVRGGDDAGVIFHADQGRGYGG